MSFSDIYLFLDDDSMTALYAATHSVFMKIALRAPTHDPAAACFLPPMCKFLL
jgi:hypothetical protein